MIDFIQLKPRINQSFLHFGGDSVLLKDVAIEIVAQMP